MSATAASQSSSLAEVPGIAGVYLSFKSISATELSQNYLLAKVSGVAHKKHCLGLKAMLIHRKATPAGPPRILLGSG